MSADSLPAVQTPRRYMFLGVALEVARGFPEPTHLRFARDGRSLFIEVDNPSAMAAWAQWAEASAVSPTFRVGERHGWRIAVIEMPTADPPQPRPSLVAENLIRAMDHELASAQTAVLPRVESDPS